MRDPRRPSSGEANIGSAAMARPSGRDWELGVVVVYNSATHTATVKTHRGRPLQNVPQLKPSSGSYDHLAVGTTVAVGWNLGFPVIMGCIEDVGLPQAAIPSTSLTGVTGVGSEDPTQTTRGTNNYRPPNAPTDMGGGDWARVGTLGNHVAVLEGGVALLGSPTAQLRSIGPTGTMQTVAQRIQQLTDFGEMRVENDQGRTSFILRAGANQATETGMDEQHWTIRLDLGATGDMLNFQILEPEGKVLFRLHAGSDGRVQIYGDGGVDISSGEQGTKEHRSDVAGSRATAISGDDTSRVTGLKRTSVDQSSETSIGGDSMLAIGGSMTELSTGSRSSGIGGDNTRVIVGARTTTIGKDDKTDTDGKWSVFAKRGTLLTTNGDFTARAAGKAMLDGRQVVLGSKGSHPAPKFDVFLRDFGTFLGDLMSALANTIPLNPFAVPAIMAKLALFAAKVNMGIPYKSLKVSND